MPPDDPIQCGIGVVRQDGCVCCTLEGRQYKDNRHAVGVTVSSNSNTVATEVG